MSNELMDLSKNLLISHIQGKINSYETIHPWRKEWEFALQHSMRVLSYTKKIISEENLMLPEDDVTLLYTSAILHDVGRMDETEDHAHYGAQIVKSWFDTNPDFSRMIPDKERLIYIIETHSNKDIDDNDPCCNILKDADTLDEIGAMSIFMCSNWLDKASPWFFNQLHERLKDHELKFCDKKMLCLKTRTARKILLEKRSFIEHFIMQLENELGETLKISYPGGTL